MRGNRKKTEKKFFENGKVKKQKKMREERKIEKVSRLVIGSIVRHKCMIFITSSKLTNTNTTYGTFPCNRTLCLLCPHINPTNTVTGPNRAQYHIKGSFNCNTANLIFAITCTLCPNSLYIGETGNTLRQRLNGHKSDIRKKKKHTGG